MQMSSLLLPENLCCIQGLCRTVTITLSPPFQESVLHHELRSRKLRGCDAKRHAVTMRNAAQFKGKRRFIGQHKIMEQITPRRLTPKAPCDPLRIFFKYRLDSINTLSCTCWVS
jgi:hypothetical protein